MAVYSIIMFFVSLLLAGISIGIYQGKTGLIHDYHQTKVTDKSAYGKSFGKALSVISAAMFLSGTIALFGNLETSAAIAVAVLIFGLIIGIACIIAAQKKYNNGIF